ncbi:unnamed protein product [Blepharisma stoltei]|uniref:Uncharacterized protein n=1 Tax=Blepharisma stoltei TaxID=1481888 RepID=A0AAU9K1G4_9CILI|nr:unnamed protein product [Blepharisma stoltei]
MNKIESENQKKKIYIENQESEFPISTLKSYRQQTLFEEESSRVLCENNCKIVKEIALHKIESTQSIMTDSTLSSADDRSKRNNFRRKKLSVDFPKRINGKCIYEILCGK